MYRLTPLTGRITDRLQRRFGRRSGIEAAATRTWRLSRGSDRVVPPAIFDSEDLQKITGVDADNTIETQVARAKGGLQHHRPTTAFELREVVLSHGHLFTHGLVHRVGRSAVPWFTSRDLTYADEAVLASSAYGIRYFGHWLADDLPLTLAARSIGRPISLLTSPTPHQIGYLQLLGLQVDVPSGARFHKLVVLDDVGQNDYKRERYAALRELGRPSATPIGGRMVMLLRGDSGERRVLQNEAQVADAFVRRGGTVIDTRTCTVAEIIAACFDAELVLGVEGSQLVNGLAWMSDRGTVVVLQPPQRFSVLHKDRCDCVGIRFAFIVGDPREGGDFWIDVPRLERLLDRLG